MIYILELSTRVWGFSHAPILSLTNPCPSVPQWPWVLIDRRLNYRPTCYSPKYVMGFARRLWDDSTARSCDSKWKNHSRLKHLKNFFWGSFTPFQTLFHSLYSKCFVTCAWGTVYALRANAACIHPLGAICDPCILFWCVHNVMLAQVINKKWHHLLTSCACAQWTRSVCRCRCRGSDGRLFNNPPQNNSERAGDRRVLSPSVGGTVTQLTLMRSIVPRERAAIPQHQKLIEYSNMLNRQTVLWQSVRSWNAEWFIWGKWISVHTFTFLSA